MITIETHGTVTPDGRLSVRLPATVEPGEHRVVVIEERLSAPQGHPPADFPVVDLGPWPPDLPLRREDMYGDGGRS